MKSVEDIVRNKILKELIMTGEFSYIVFLKGVNKGYDVIELTEEEIEGNRNFNVNGNIYPYINSNM